MVALSRADVVRWPQCLPGCRWWPLCLPGYVGGGPYAYLGVGGGPYAYLGVGAHLSNCSQFEPLKLPNEQNSFECPVFPAKIPGVKNM